MKFLDEAKIYLSSGKGGAGAVSFRREKYIPRGGPDGGNGGRGGHIIFQTNPNLNTLIDFRYKQHFKAQSGKHGMGRNKSGPRGEDMLIQIPIGTEIIDDQTGQVLMDFNHPEQSWQILTGGKGGRGNAMFATSVNQAPRNADPGLPGEEMWVRLRLKLLADVGLLGFPNAGKSTFLSVISNAKPEVADYPFTTLTPQLGMVRRYGQDMVVADLPGLIEGAAEGRGMGHRFLKHLSRCSVVLHLIDGTSEDPVTSYKTIRSELKNYDAEFNTEDTSLSNLPEVIVLSKNDAMLEEEVKNGVEALKKASGQTPLLLSAVTGEGVDVLLDTLLNYVKEARAAKLANEAKTLEEGPTVAEPEAEII